MQNKNINVILEFIMNSIDCIVYIVIVFTGNMHTILADMDLAAKWYFRRHIHITMYDIILLFIYY